MTQLPGDIHRLIADILTQTERYSIKDIVSYCKTSVEINRAVCNNQNYWITRASVLSNNRELLQQKSLPDLRKALFLYEKYRPDPVYFAREGYEKAVREIMSYPGNASLSESVAEAAATNGYFDIAEEIVDTIKESPFPEYIPLRGLIRGIVIGNPPHGQELFDKLISKLHPQLGDQAYLEGLAKGGYLEQLQEDITKRLLAGYDLPSSRLMRGILRAAIKGGSVPVVSYLLEFVPEERELVEAVITALIHGRQEIYQNLMAMLSDKAKDDHFSDILAAAVKGENLQEVQRMIESNPDLINVTLELAAKYGKEKIVIKLIPLIRDKKAIKTAIEHALKAGQLDMVHLLLPYDDPTKRKTYLMSAVIGRDPEAIREFMPFAGRPEFVEAFNYAVNEGYSSLLPLFTSGITPQNIASLLKSRARIGTRGNIDAIRALLTLNPQRSDVQAALEVARDDTREILQSYLDRT